MFTSIFPKHLFLLPLVLYWTGCLCCVKQPGPASQSKTTQIKMPAAGGWQILFDGKSLKGWKETAFAGAGKVQVIDGELRIEMGLIMTGANYTNVTPRLDYEIEYEAKKTDGADFFAALTFPVGTKAVTFINGGWGGAVTGISSIDMQDASENETTKYLKFEKGQWYKFRIRVTAKKLQVWMDDKVVIEQDIAGRDLSMRAGEIELSAPFGIAAYQSSAAIRNIRVRELPKP